MLSTIGKQFFNEPDYTSIAPFARVFERMTLILSYALTDTPVTMNEDINEHIDIAARAIETYSVEQNQSKNGIAYDVALSPPTRGRRSNYAENGI